MKSALKASQIISIAVLGVALPASGLAATYEYVTTAGTLATVEASSGVQAIANAQNIAARSGVVLVTGSGTSNSSTSMAPAAESAEAAGLRTALRTLLSEHVTVSVDVLREIEDRESNNDSDLTEALEKQEKNSEDLGAAIASVYGAEAGTMFTDMFKEHVVASNDYTQALVDGDDEAADEALDELTEYLEEISTFLAGANPNIDRATLLSALTEHEQLLNESSEAYIAGDTDEADDLEREAVEQIKGGADYLAGAIIAQFPDKF